MSTKQKIVKMNESELVNLIDGIVEEAVAERKKEWIAEHEAKSATVIEERIKSLEDKITSLTEGKE